MLRYSLRRALGAIPTLFVLLTLAFFMIRLAPGGPFDSDRRLPPDIEANLNQKYHLDEPLPKQYVRYIGSVLRGDFGPSFKYRDITVNQLIAQGFPVSARLGIAAMVLALFFGVGFGTLAALRQNGMTDYGVMGVAMLGISIPNFVLAPLLILGLAVYLQWLPAGGLGSAKHYVLPVLTLAMPQIAYIARLTRGSMIEVLRANYIRTARAKGLPLRLVLFRHALPAAMVPVASYLGPAIAGIITGSVVIETVFGIPGLGRYFVQGALNRDYTLVMGVVLFYGILIILLNFLVDLLYALAGPAGEILMTQQGAITAETLAALPRGHSLWHDAWQRLRHNKAALVSGILLAVLAVAVVVGPWLSPYEYDQIDWEHLLSPPDIASQHWFGTDSLGRDLFVRTLYGGRISLLVGIVATLVSLIIGVSWGATAGFMGGRVDSFMMRIVDILYALPFMFFLILLMVFFGRHLVLIFIAIGMVNWLDMSRIVRGQTLSLKRKEFIEAAWMAGADSGQIIRRHIIPNLMGVVVVYVTLTIPHVILAESFLSFLGLGVQEPSTSWGALVNEGAQEMRHSPWVLIFPASFLALTLFCFNFIGDGLRDALDPKDR